MEDLKNMMKEIIKKTIQMTRLKTILVANIKWKYKSGSFV